MMEEVRRRTRAPRKNQAPRAKKETAVKRETRSRHEKKRREEMNEVINEMMELLPDNLESMKKADQKPRQPDKCFIIGSSVEMIKNSDYIPEPSLLSDPLTRDVFGLANSFMIFLNHFIISDIEGDHRPIFDVEKIRMLGKDIRCFLNFQSGTKLSFLDPNQLVHQLQLRSFMDKAMSCRMRNSDESPSEAVLVCVPDELAKIQSPPIPAPPTSYSTQITPPKSPPPSKMEEERPILAALLRRKEPEASPFLSPSSSSCSTVPQKSTVSRKSTVAVPQKRKRLRSMNVIVESFPLDGKEEEEEEEGKRKQRKRQPTATPTTTTTTATTTTTNYTPTIAHPIPTTSTMGINPFDVLAPGYRDIWLRLQSERLILEERIAAKQGELKSLMNLVQQPPPFLNVPQYLMPPVETLTTHNL
uniref:BHLH domain-containing protein n=1 Tax=Caenorhabditis tropicalis TaxID=1561998 RepID=A0A1I7UX02_9PELO